MLSKNIVNVAKYKKERLWFKTQHMHAWYCDNNVHLFYSKEAIAIHYTYSGACVVTNWLDSIYIWTIFICPMQTKAKVCVYIFLRRTNAWHRSYVVNKDKILSYQLETYIYIYIYIYIYYVNQIIQCRTI